MKKLHLSFAFLLLALVLATVPAAFAQDETFGLSQSDYDLWQAGWANLSGVDFASYNFTTTLKASGLSATDVTADLTGSGVLSTSSDNPMFQLDVTGTINDGTQATDVNVGVRVVDGYLYYNDGTGWKGETLDAAMSTATSMFDMGLASAGSDATVDPSQLQSGDLSGLAGMSGIGDAMAGLSSLNPADFITVVRSDADGQALFTLNFDLAKFVSSPEITSLMASQMDASGSGDATPNSQMSMVPMLTSLLSMANVSVDQYVDTSSEMLSRLAVNFSLPLGQDAGITLNFDLSLSGVNEPVSVEAPADAVMMDATAGG